MANRGENFLWKQWLVMACLTVYAGPLYGQILHATSPLPSFEVATIKPSSGGNAIPSISLPTESRTINVSARNLIEQAYRIPWTSNFNERVVGGPAWIDILRYDVDARIDPAQADALQKMSNEQQKDQTSLMMQSLLADRFKLKVHFESRELPIYALLVAKSGPKLAPANEPSAAEGDQPPQPTLPAKPEDVRKGIFVLYRGQQAEMTAKGVTLDELVHWLAGYSEIGGRTVVNQTGLSGAYDFTLRWTRERLTATGQQDDSPNSAALPESGGPAMFTGLQEELGLRLLSTKGPVEVLVIDHIEKPSEN